MARLVASDLLVQFGKTGDGSLEGTLVPLDLLPLRFGLPRRLLKGLLGGRGQLGESADTYGQIGQPFARRLQLGFEIACKR